MIKLGVFQVKTKGHGFVLSVEKEVEITEKSIGKEGKSLIIGTGEFKNVVTEIGFYSKVDQVVNRIIQHEMYKQGSAEVDLKAFLKTINTFTSALQSYKGN